MPPKPLASPPLTSPWNFAQHLASEVPGLRKRERTQTAILIAAATLLAEPGPARLTVAEVCKSAKIAHGTLYLHFSDLNALLTALLLRFIEFIQISMRRGVAGDMVRAATEAYYELFAENPGLMRCLVIQTEAYPEATGVFQKLNREWLLTVVAAARRRPANAQLSEAELLRRAYALGGMVDQYLTAIFLHQDPTLTAVSTEREAVIDTLTTLWKQGLST